MFMHRGITDTDAQGMTVTSPMPGYNWVGHVGQTTDVADGEGSVSG